MRKIFRDLPVCVFAADALFRMEQNPEVGEAARYIENTVYEKLDGIKNCIKPLAVADTITPEGDRQHLIWQGQTWTLQKPLLTDRIVKISLCSVTMGADIDAAYDQCADDHDYNGAIIEAIGQAALINTIEQVRESLSRAQYDEELECAAFIALEDFLIASEQTAFWQRLDPDLQWEQQELVAPRLSCSFFLLWRRIDPANLLWQCIKV